MFKRNRDRLITIGVLIAGALLTTWITLTGFDLTRSDIATRDVERANAGAHSYDAAEPERCIHLISPEDLESCKREQAEAQHQKQHTEADLHAQSDMASYARGLLWFTAFGFVASAGGLVALVWTFNEQRKLTQNQACAYLEILQGRVSEHTELGFSYELDVVSNGQTPSRRIQLIAKMKVSGVPHIITYGDDPIYTPRTISLEANASEIFPTNQRTLIARTYDWIGLDAFNPEGHGSAARRYGSRITTGDPDEDGPEAYLEITGTLAYDDVFGRRHELPIHQFMFMNFGGILRGTGRNAARFPGDE